MNFLFLFQNFSPNKRLMVTIWICSLQCNLPWHCIANSIHRTIIFSEISSSMNNQTSVIIAVGKKLYVIMRIFLLEGTLAFTTAQKLRCSLFAQFFLFFFFFFIFSLAKIPSRIEKGYEPPPVRPRRSDVAHVRFAWFSRVTRHPADRRICTVIQDDPSVPLLHVLSAWSFQTDVSGYFLLSADYLFSNHAFRGLKTLVQRIPY